MRYGSVCSGVEAASLAWMPLGWECKFVAEVEPFPCAVLQERFGATAPIHPLDPEEATNEKDRKMRISWMKQNKSLKKEGIIPNEGDFTKIGKKHEGQIDLLVGGTPCQDLSVAGKRAGFGGERSSLAIDFVRLAYESQCKWFVWENVPGVFSSNGGRDFATLLSLFVGRTVTVPKNGWSSAGFVCNDRRDRFGVAWRVLDAQFTRTSGFPFAIPQRRRRVFLVGYFGDWTRAAEVLLEPERMCWDTPARFKARERIAGIAQDSVRAASTVRMRSGCEGGGKGALVSNEVSLTLAAGSNDQTLFIRDSSNKVFWNGKDVAESLTGSSNEQLMPDKARLQCIIDDVAETLDASYYKGSTVRRLLPIECERLMGFPDNHTRIAWKGNPEAECPDSPRYKACGNSMCVNCMEWLGERISEVENMK
jgi:DNA (cytosine-5)-methyltransferase 1